MSYIIYLILSILISSSIVVFTLKRSLNYLHVFQQHEYDRGRFLYWILTNLAIDKRLTGSLFIFFGAYHGIFINLARSPSLNWLIKFIITLFIIIIFTFLEKDPLKQAKKKLVLTHRATRIYYVTFFLNFLTNLYLLLHLNSKNHLLSLLLAIHSIPLSLLIADLLLIPVENIIQQKIIKSAKEILAKLDPTIIGITGSFGKTSVKHFLGHILGQVEHTLITSGSINTVMGICRIIREELNSNHKYFLVEMGAYNIGSIHKICQLTPPTFGIITAIGTAHYERFRDLENVAMAKFELANNVINNRSANQAVLSDGKCATDPIKNEHASLELDLNSTNVSEQLSTKPLRSMVISEQVINTNYAKVYTQNKKNHFAIVNQDSISKIQQLATGLTWDLQVAGVTYSLTSPIFGKHNVMNLSLAFVAAYNLQIPVANIIAAIQTMPQIPHRLEVKKEHNLIIIDDSYNANLDGVRSGLELLSLLNEADSRKILITPGLVELGNQHQEEHFQLGVLAAKHVDLAIVVNPDRIDSFIQGFNQTADPNQVIVKVPTFSEAQNWLRSNTKPKDLVLIANDLPDLYEVGLKI